MAATRWSTLLAHVLFETIHPFLDGNGRLGRLLIVRMPLEADVLHPLMPYQSLFLKQHRSRYELLGSVCPKRRLGSLARLLP